MQKKLIIGILFVAGCSASPAYEPLPYIPIKPICSQENELHIQYFRLCLSKVPEEKRVAFDLSRCDTVAEVQAIDQCQKLGYAP